MIRNAEEIMREVGEGSLDKEKTSTDPPSSARRSLGADVVKRAANVAAHHKH